ELPFETVAARLGTPEVTARTRVHRALDSLRARLGSLRAIFVVPGAQAAVLAVTVVAVQLPAAPNTIALAMADDPVATVDRPQGRRVKVVAVPPPPAPKETAARDARRGDINACL